MFSDNRGHALLDLYGDSPARYKILLVFVSHPVDAFNLREIAREAEIGTSTIHRHKDFLQYLNETGFLRVRTDSGVDKYRLNAESKFAETAVEWYRINEKARQFHESETEEDTTIEFYK